MLQPIQDALRRNDLDTAIRLAREALVSLPSSPDLLHLLAVGLLNKGAQAEGEDALAQAIALAPHRGGFLVTRGELAFARQQYESALQDLSAAVRLDPNLLAAYVGLARLELMRGEHDTAEAHVKYARRINPDHPALLRVETALAVGRGDLDAALSASNRAVQLQPNNPELHLELAMVYQRRGVPAVAAQALRNALRLAPGMRTAERMLVSVLLDAHEPREAHDLLVKILNREPNDAGGWGLLGGIALGLGNAGGCEQATLQSLAIEPEQPALIGRLMELWARAQAAPRARAALDALLQRHPHSTALWNARFSLDALSPEGQDVLERWRAAQPDSLDVREAAAQRALSLGDLQQAESLAAEVLARDPQRVGASLVMVRTERERDPESALQRLAALAQRPLSFDLKRSVASLRGQLLDGLGRFDEALAVWLGVYAIESDQSLPGLPLPGFLPAGPALAADAPRGAEARLFWPLPGTPVVPTLESLGALAPFLLDRFSSQDRADGLGPLRPDIGHHGEQGAEAPWREHLRSRGLEPAGVVDVLPHVDPELLSALPDARLLVLMGDPRELLLNWIAFGSLQGYLMLSPELTARWYAQALAPLQARLAAAPERTHLLRIEALKEAPREALQQAAAFLGLDGEPADYLPAKRPSMDRFELPAERWRQYAQGPLAEAFEILAPVAEALGYAP